MTITFIGPVAIPSLHLPTKLEVGQNPDPLGGVSITLQTVIRNRKVAGLIPEMVRNPLRRQSFGPAAGVLEWVETSGPFAPYRGWWLIESATIGYDGHHGFLPETESYVPINISGVFYGQKHPVVMTTHQERADNFAVNGQALTPGLYPIPGLDFNVAPIFIRYGPHSGINDGVGVYGGVANKAHLRMEGLEPAFVELRPAAVEALSGVRHYGSEVGPDPILNDSYITTPHAWERYLQTISCRVRPHGAGFFIVEAPLPGRLSYWSRVGTVGVYNSGQAQSTHVRAVDAVRLYDDRAEMDVQDNAGRVVTVVNRSADLGVRFRARDNDRRIEVRPRLAVATGVSYGAGKYGNGAILTDATDVLQYKLHPEFESRAPFTVCGWYLPAETTHTGQRTLLQLAGATDQAVQVYLPPNSAVVTAYRIGGGTPTTVTSSVSVVAATQTFFCARYDGTDLTVTAKTGAGALAHSTLAAATNVSGVEDLYLGVHLGVVNQCRGTMDNVMVFNRWLTDAEVAAIAGGAAAEDGITSSNAANLVGLWRLTNATAEYSPPSAIATNYLLEVGGEGLTTSKRFVALQNTATVDLPNWVVSFSQGQEVFFGIQPALPATNDTAAEQAKQFLFDRWAQLTLD